MTGNEAFWTYMRIVLGGTASVLEYTHAAIRIIEMFWLGIIHVKILTYAWEVQRRLGL